MFGGSGFGNANDHVSAQQSNPGFLGVSGAENSQRSAGGQEEKQRSVGQAHDQLMTVTVGALVREARRNIQLGSIDDPVKVWGTPFKAVRLFRLCTTNYH